MTIGETEIFGPEDTSVPPQVPENQYQLAPYPRNPPLIFNVIEEPGHILEGLENAETGDWEESTGTKNSGNL